MKKIFVFTVISILTAQSFAAVVKSAKLDASRENIIIDVTYGGGCAKHNFTLKMKGCLDSLPAQCKAILVDNTKNDRCEAIINQSVVIPLDSEIFEGYHTRRATLTIVGDKSWETQKESTATVRLP